MIRIKKMSVSTGRNPWQWIPTLYMAEGLPYFAVNVLAVMLYTRMGVSNSEMAFFTGWLYLPWVIKPFWSPFVDIIHTKRWWAISMQYLIALTMGCVAFCLPLPFYFAATLSAFWLMAFFSATHDIAADGYYMLALSEQQQAAYVGVRSTFYRIASVIGQGGLVWMAGEFEDYYGEIPTAWSMVFVVLSVGFLAIAVYNNFMMPRADSDRAVMLRVDVDKVVAGKDFKSIISNFGKSFATFFKKKYVVSSLLFMLLYRLPEAMLIKLVQPFLVAPLSEGGLGMSVKDVGIANGVVGVVALLIGGIVGGVCISVGGLKKWLWPMALSLTMPCAFYVYLAIVQPADLLLVNICIFVEQFGYGFGFTAFMLYLIYFSEGEFKTSHYSFCTAFMALGMMLPGMMAGYIQEWLSTINLLGVSGPQGYVNFFLWVMVCCIATFAVCFIVKIDKGFGKKR